MRGRPASLARGLRKMKSAQVVLPMLAAVVAASAANAAACDRLTQAAVEVTVHEAPLSINEALSLAELRAMAAQSSQPFIHPVLGFYSGSVGYVLQRMDVRAGPSQADGKRPCPRVETQAELVAIDRRVVIARDLSGVPCRFQAAVAHYGRHAAVASLALHQFAAELPRALGAEIDRYVRSRPAWSQAQEADLRRYVGDLLDHAVETFTASLVNVQAGVDSPGEIRGLTVPCGDT